MGGGVFADGVFRLVHEITRATVVKHD